MPGEPLQILKSKFEKLKFFGVQCFVVRNYSYFVKGGAQPMNGALTIVS